MVEGVAAEVKDQASSWRGIVFLWQDGFFGREMNAMGLRLFQIDVRCGIKALLYRALLKRAVGTEDLFV